MTAPPTYTPNIEHEETLNPQPIAIRFDAAEFVHFLEESDLTHDQKVEYVRMIWDIVLQFVDLGFGLHPIQQACGKFHAAPVLCDKSGNSALDSSHPDLGKEFTASGTRRGKIQIPHMQGGDAA